MFERLSTKVPNPGETVAVSSGSGTTIAASGGSRIDEWEITDE